MRSIIFVLLLLCNLKNAIAQRTDLGESGRCQVNVNNRDWIYNTDYRRPIIDATFKISYVSRDDGKTHTCTGTLINRNTSSGEVGFYFISANHCDINFSKQVELYFNYQSMDAVTHNIPLSNKGYNVAQSTSLSDNNYQYIHKTMLRNVGEYFWGDFRLCEILVPLPPHYNYSYAGWNPNRFYTSNVYQSTPLFIPYATIHHPSRDIKKIAGTHRIAWLENPISTGCYTVTVIIDALFGWIWGRRFSTQVVCNYINNPYVMVPYFTVGVVEHGSSGAALLNGGNRVIGTLSGLWGTCDVPVAEPYGKFYANYQNQAVKNTLNPNNDYWVDLWGLPERRITCFDNLVLPATSQGPGYYFAPKDYNDHQDAMMLQSRSKIINDKPITVFPQAKYTFRAPQSVTFGPGFHVQSGAVVTAEIGNCPSGSSRLAANPAKQQMMERLAAIKLPKKKTFEMAQYARVDSARYIRQQLESSLYPNPATNNTTFRFALPEAQAYVVSIWDMVGREVSGSTQMGTKGWNDFSFSVLDLPAGTYLLRIEANGFKETRRLTVIK